MEITKEEALSLLRKWQQERRLMEGKAFFDDKISSNVLGRIENVSTEEVTIDDRSFVTGSTRYGMIVYLASVTRFSFEDHRFAEGLEEADQIRESYEGFLFLKFAGGGVVHLLAARTGNEINAGQL
jgi:hypothetical protein